MQVIRENSYRCLFCSREAYYKVGQSSYCLQHAEVVISGYNGDNLRGTTATPEGVVRALQAMFVGEIKSSETIIELAKKKQLAKERRYLC